MQGPRQNLRTSGTRPQQESPQLGSFRRGKFGDYLLDNAWIGQVWAARLYGGEAGAAGTVRGSGWLLAYGGRGVFEVAPYRPAPLMSIAATLDDEGTFFISESGRKMIEEYEMSLQEDFATATEATPLASGPPQVDKPKKAKKPRKKQRSKKSKELFADPNLYLAGLDALAGEELVELPESESEDVYAPDENRRTELLNHPPGNKLLSKSPSSSGKEGRNVGESCQRGRKGSVPPGMNHADEFELAALSKQFERFAHEKRPVEAFEIFEEFARRSGGLQRIDPESVRVVLQLFAESDPGGGRNTWQKLLFLWCRERRWDDGFIARFFLDLVDELNEEGEDLPAAMDQLALSLEPSSRRWLRWAQWQLAELNMDGEFNGLSAPQTVDRLHADGWHYDFREIGRHPSAKSTLEKAPKLASEPSLQGVLEFFLQWI